MLFKKQLQKIPSTASIFLHLKNNVKITAFRQKVLFAKGWERRDSTGIWRELILKQIYTNIIGDYFAANTRHNEVLEVMIGQRRARSTDAPAAGVEKNKENESETENAPKRRSARLTRNTRSMAENRASSPEEPVAKQLPYIKYSGAIQYLTDGNEIAEASDYVMKWVEEQSHMELVPMAFDMEWPFSFQTGPGKSSVIQICVQEHCCYVFQLTNVKRLPAALMALLKHPKVRLHGVNIKNDFRKLARDFPEVNADVLIEKCMDLGVWCNQVYGTGGRWSLERLANFIVQRAMDKSKKVRMSKWHVIPLDENQLMYAAIDVYIGQVIYRELEQRHQVKITNELDFKTKNGEAAFKVIKALGETFIDTDVKSILDEKSTTESRKIE